MKKFRLSLLGGALLMLAFTSVASAQSTRTWVSGLGDDANPCSRTAPCKTFAGAISKTASNGEIDCIDPGGFGAISILKSITIDCDSGPGGILPGATNGATINIAGGTVTLRSINFQGVGSGLNGVNIVAAAAVHLVDLNIYSFTQAGVNAATSASLVLTIDETRIHDCANGIVTTTSAGLITADYGRVSLYNGGSGVNASNGSRVQLHNSTIVAFSAGVNQTGLGASGSVVTAFGNSFTGNGNALQSSAGGSIGASGNVFSTNSLVYNPNGGSISTASDNPQFGNAGTGLANGPAVTKI
ncbi:MAG: right-handed parallel beta-helix repeat-containing protein [Acidobacteriota bacterium]|nr:right-handed parallel beta-helix repeat-containing protein [Acidobacteriota bacterium]